jgi:hypothetical protein
LHRSSKPQEATAIRCVECRRDWRDGSERWRVYLTDDDPPTAVPYCPDCAQREFDER